jgi:DivIVA domain-containing protein
LDQDSIDRIRSASFPVARKGYEKREVDRFLSRLADWLETGGADESRSDLVRRELERIGEQTAKILTDAHDAAESVRAESEAEGERVLSQAREQAAATTEEANRYAAGMRSESDAYSERVRIEADTYARETNEEADAYMARHRNEADTYADETRAAADAYAQTTRSEADTYAEQARGDADRDANEVRQSAGNQANQTIADAEGKAATIIEEANRRREDIESVISDLEARRDHVIADMQKLSSELTGTASTHKGAPVEDASGQDGADPEPEPAATPRGSPQ